MPRPNTHLFAALLVVALTLVACGGGEDQPESTATTVPPSVAAPVDIPPQTAAPDPAAPTAAAPRVRLGDRFEVCGDVQSNWDERAAALAAYEVAQLGVADAEADVEAATDDLDRAEAQEVLKMAQSVLREARDRHEAATWTAGAHLIGAMFTHERGDDTPQAIINARAWEAFVSAADTATLAALHDAEAAEAAVDAAIEAQDAAEHAYNATYEQSLADAAAAAAAADDALTAAQDAWAEQNDLHRDETWLVRWGVVLPEEFDARNQTSAHHKAVRNGETSELVALRETVRDLDNARRDALGAETDAREAREGAVKQNAETTTSAYAVFQRSFQESCQ